ncbi:hypothetical protein SDC9_146115 [bioreactor metagenome]|uniref:Uncharacterized protein n=1 Tax=bioreactor metagenome TaxID=1076179 RepID=A0A645EBR0_9ZZZZ
MIESINVRGMKRVEKIRPLRGALSRVTVEEKKPIDIITYTNKNIKYKN